MADHGIHKVQSFERVGPHALRVAFGDGSEVWPNGADSDPTTLHDWPTVVDELATRARSWTT